MTFDKPTLKALRIALDAALGPVAKQHGIQLRVGNISFTPTTFTAKLEGAAIQSDGIVASRERADYARYCRAFGLPADGLDKRFTTGGETYRITGIRARKRRCPVQAERARDGRTALFPVETVVALLARGAA